MTNAQLPHALLPESSNRSKATHWLWAATLVGLAISALLLWQIAHWLHNSELEQLNQRAVADISRYATSLRNELEQYRSMPELLASNTEIHKALTNPDDPEQIQRTNLYLQQINQIISASDIYLMTPNGKTLASSNWQLPSSFVGKNFNYRPYFQVARDGLAGQYFALGTTSLKRGYYFSYPVWSASGVIGVMVVKIDLNDIEQQWSDTQIDLLVTDIDNVVFISTRPEWKFKTLTPLSDSDLKRILSSRRYANQVLTSLPVLSRTPYADADDSEFITLLEKDPKDPTTLQGLAGTEYMLVKRTMPEAELNIVALAKIAPTAEPVWKGVGLTAAALLLLLLTIAFIWLRRRITIERIEYQRLTNAALEHRVAERTTDLMAVNTQLTDEMKRHQETQNELIQTAKLAILGQLSAGINHELNQPLTAIRAYADNAKTFLQQQKVERAEHNLTEIIGLTERMVKIIAPLKIFARKTNNEVEPVSLQAALSGAQSVLYARLQQAEVSVKWPSVDGLMVMGDMLRLEQVLVNLISNSLYEVADSTIKEIDIRCQQVAENGLTWVLLSVRDTGPGIDTEQLDKIFEPFYTTKQKGEGLGLGLSISQRIAESLDGSLTAANHPEGGAIFTLKLKMVKP